MRVDEVVTPLYIINRYIDKNSLPLNSVNFQILAIDYNIEPTFALATFILETGYGKSEAWVTNNNPAGIKCGEDYCSYQSKDEGLAMMFDLLHSYTNGSIPWIGMKNTIEEIRASWNPETDDSQKNSRNYARDNELKGKDNEKS